MEKILGISLKLNFTPNTLGRYGLKAHYVKKFIKLISPLRDKISIQ